MKRVYYGSGGVISLVLKPSRASDLSKAPPGDFIEVSDTTDIPNLSAYRVQNGQLVIHDLVPLKRDAKRFIDSRIGEEREVHITSVAGQEMIYRQKAKEAEIFLSFDPVPTDLSPYPFIEAELGITGDTAVDVANSFQLKAGQWKVIGANLERIRLGAKKRVEESVDESSIQTALDWMENQISIGV